MAPFMAADALGRPPILLADLLAELTWPDPVDLGLVEAAGGVRSPITTDGADTLDLATALDPDITLLVADAGLGVINAVRLSLDALARPGTIVFLNHYDQTSDLHRRNRAWLQQGTPADIASTIDELGDLVGALLWPRRRAVRTAKGPSGRLGSTQDQGGRHHAEVRDRAGPARSRRPDE
jgi:dethiobiotin synthetase